MVFLETKLKDSLCSILPAKLVVSSSNRDTGPIATNINAAPVPYLSFQRHYSSKHTYSSTQQLYAEILATGLASDDIPYRIVRCCTAPIIRIDL